MNNKKKSLCVVITTIDSLESAKKMAREIIKNKLAACVNIFPVNSIYYWENKVIEDNEVMLFIKTSEERAIKLRNWLLDNHPYKVPEILIMNAESNADYYDWLTNYIEKENS